MHRIRVWALGLLATLLGLGWALSPVRQAAACDCAPPPPPKKALEQSAAVFLAKVVAIEDAAQEVAGRVVTLEVETWWKGGDAATLKVSTSKSGATCGYGFQKDGRYLIYAYAETDAKTLLRVSLCSRTCTADQAKTSDDFKELGEGKAPAAKK